MSVILAAILVFPFFCFSQEDSISVDRQVRLGAGYIGQMPGGDLAERFVSNSNVGLNVAFINGKNWLFSLEGNYLFRDSVKETGFFDNIDTEDGYLIGQDGLFASYVLQQRGLHIHFDVGKIFPYGFQKRGGFVVKGGIGYLQHKIKFQHDDETVRQLIGDYKKGYDRLTSGISLIEYLGYNFGMRTSSVQLHFGVEFIQAFTKSRRSYNFSTLQKDDQSRLDLLFGLHVGLSISLHKQQPKEFYFY